MSPRNSAVEARRTRDRILDRSVALASLDGLDGLTIGRLAEELGMSKAGVLGHFRTKQALQLAVLDRASAIFGRLVWEPVTELPPGLPRLRTLCERWIDYLEHEREIFPGGCLFSTAAMEFDGGQGPVRDMVARLLLLWRRRLVNDLRYAVEAGQLAPGADPEQIAFEISGLYLGLNQAIQLLGDRSAPGRTRRALDRMLAR